MQLAAAHTMIALVQQTGGALQEFLGKILNLQ
jgi:hypothetical protein